VTTKPVETLDVRTRSGAPVASEAPRFVESGSRELAKAEKLGLK
jgi:hypothetical protein